jgi:hypothetical protein
MQHMLANGFLLGLSEAQVALLVSAAAFIFALKRWRRSVVRKNSASERAEEEHLDRSPADHHPMEMGRDGRAYRSGLNVSEVATELSSLLADLEETSRRVAAQIENRRTGLELLLKEADEKIKRLETLTHAAGVGAGPSAAAARVEPFERAPQIIGAARDAAATLSRLRAERGAPSAAEDPAYRPIYVLADKGKSAREIAQELGRQPGEVELILALRGRQRVG